MPKNEKYKGRRFSNNMAKPFWGYAECEFSRQIVRIAVSWDAMLGGF